MCRKNLALSFHFIAFAISTLMRSLVARKRQRRCSVPCAYTSCTPKWERISYWPNASSQSSIESLTTTEASYLISNVTDSIIIASIIISSSWYYRDETENFFSAALAVIVVFIRTGKDTQPFIAQKSGSLLDYFCQGNRVSFSNLKEPLVITTRLWRPVL